LAGLPWVGLQSAQPLAREQRWVALL
jgi:hypothetical protein